MPIGSLKGEGITMRLDKYLSKRTSFSRNDIKKLAASKKICVNNIIALKADMNINEETDNITINNLPVRKEEFLTLLMNKPDGYISATEDKTEKTVIDLLPKEFQGQNLSPVGRLDKDTTGLLLLTNDGNMLHDLTSPKKHIPKYYKASLAEKFTPKAAELIANGITLKDGTKCLPAKAVAISDDAFEIIICINEGKYHQVKRMLAATGNRVKSLSRIAIGEFIIPQDLPAGSVRIMTDKDLCKVFKTQDIFLSLVNLFRKCSS